MLTAREWKKQVTEATDKKNKEKLLKMCYSRNGEKMKTKGIIETLRDDSYVRAPRMDILKKSRFNSKVQIMSIFYMLKCAKNYKGSHQNENCSTCNVPDDESHRINYCVRFRETNLCDSPLKVEFDIINSQDDKSVECVIDTVSTLWNLKNGKNEMKTILDG